jgi:hypothetical protein
MVVYCCYYYESYLQPDPTSHTHAQAHTSPFTTNIIWYSWHHQVQCIIISRQWCVVSVNCDMHVHMWSCVDVFTFDMMYVMEHEWWCMWHTPHTSRQAYILTRYKYTNCVHSRAWHYERVCMVVVVNTHCMYMVAYIMYIMRDIRRILGFTKYGVCIHPSWWTHIIIDTPRIMLSDSLVGIT